MVYVDAHCDTITRIMDLGLELSSNSCHVDLERLHDRNKAVMFFAAFISPEYYKTSPVKRAITIIGRLYDEIERNKDRIKLCFDYNDVKEAIACGKVAGILSIEGGEALEGDMSILRVFYKLGVRSICLTWNHRNEIAAGVGGDTLQEDVSGKYDNLGSGLTSFGRDLIREMNSIGMLIDLSHIAEKGFWDVMECTDKPVIVSHSNAKKICSHKRNLTDDQIKAIKINGGVIGINLNPPFLNNSGRANIKDIMVHIEHVVGLIGEDHIGLGTDFDGIDSTPEGISGVQDINKIFEELERLNYSKRFIEKFASKNFLRVLENIM